MLTRALKISRHHLLPAVLPILVCGPLSCAIRSKSASDDHPGSKLAAASADKTVKLWE